MPEGMGLIIRTAGAARTKQEIKRDFEYLLRLWESVRDMTLQSTAPSLVYEEGNLIKRSIRDLYTKDVDEIVVAGDAAHREARDFMRMLMPSHAKNVIDYREPEPLFTRYQIERQLNAMFSPYVTLRRAAISSSTRPRRWSRSTSTPASRRASSRSRRRRSTPTSRPPTRSPASSSCATSPA